MKDRKYSTADLTISHQFVKQCPGTDLAMATHPQFQAPVALIWFTRSTPNVIDITSCFTVGHFRRCGFQRSLVKQLVTWWPERDIWTTRLTVEGNPAFRRIGFIKRKHGWFLPKKAARSLAA